MEGLLHQIYSGEYDFTPERDKKQQELYKELCAEWDKVQRMFGDDFMDRIFELEGELEDRRSFQSYRAGFCLGVRLLLEALTSATG